MSIFSQEKASLNKCQIPRYYSPSKNNCKAMQKYWQIFTKNITQICQYFPKKCDICSPSNNPKHERNCQYFEKYISIFLVKIWQNLPTISRQNMSICGLSSSPPSPSSHQQSIHLPFVTNTAQVLNQKKASLNKWQIPKYCLQYWVFTFQEHL